MKRRALPIDPEAAVASSRRAAHVALAVLVIGFGGAAAAVPIGGAVMAPGSVGVASHVRRVAHLTGGTVAAIYVRNGDHVARGARLIRLDDTVSGSDASLSARSVAELLAQKARLEAEQLGAPAIVFPPELAGADARAAIENERRMFAMRKRELAGLAAQLTARVAQYRQQIAGFREQIAASRRQMALIKPERAGLKELYDRGLVTLNRRNQLERQAVDYDGNVAALQTQIAQTEARISETREQLLQLDRTRRADAGTQLAQVTITLNQLHATSVSAEDLQHRTLILAPSAGVVDKLAFPNVGEVIRPAETIMEIVPDDQKVIEAMVSPTDIDQIAVGQKARIRFTAYAGATTPEVEGRLVEISANRAVDPDSKHSFYPARVSFDPAQLRRRGDFKLVPGMPAEILLQSGDRSMISYLTKPLRDQFARAFRDNAQ